jgi:hypothetical protein
MMPVSTLHAIANERTVNEAMQIGRRVCKMQTKLRSGVFSAGCNSQAWWRRDVINFIQTHIRVLPIERLTALALTGTFVVARDWLQSVTFIGARNDKVRSSSSRRGGYLQRNSCLS